MVNEKIEDFLNCYFDVTGIDDKKIRECIKNGVINRINTYNKYFPNISIEDDDYKYYAIKSINGYYSLEDFMLNRLFQGLRQIVIKDDENSKYCEYAADSRTIYISYDAIRKFIFANINNLSDEIKEKFFDIIILTVFDHELGHTLKTQFKDGYKVKKDNSKIITDVLYSKLKELFGKEEANKVISTISNNSSLVSADDMYIKLLEELSTIKDGKYAPIILKPNQLQEEYSSLVGVGLEKSSHKLDLIILDELLQETESMNNINIFKVPQGKKVLGASGNYINYFHFLSYYSPVIGYGKIINSLLGKKGTFYVTYLNPDNVFNEFNQLYSNISEEIFENDMSALENITNSLNRIMKTKSEEEYLKLDLFFSKCYDLMISDKISQGTINDIQFVIDEIESFKIRLTCNNDEIVNNNLPHNCIFNGLINKLLELKKTPTM